MFIEFFQDISKHDTKVAGGKGSSLGEMTCAGVPVPPGFVVLSSAFEEFITSSGLASAIEKILQSVSHEEIKSVELASEEIRGLILGAQMPSKIAEEIMRAYKSLMSDRSDTSGYVAVRSSASAEDSSSAAWAGQLESYLNTTEETLLENVKRCWASLFTPRAIFYRFEKNLNSQSISVAVVVQKMIQSEVSGIAFSVHPVTQDRNQMIIEAGYGLGEAIVSGQITPDNYIVGKHQIPNPKLQTNSNDQNSKNKIKTSLRGSVKQSSVVILDKNIVTQEKMLTRSFSLSLRGGGRRSNLIQTRQPVIASRNARNDVNEWVSVPQQDQTKQKLSDSEILELSELILKIENHYGFPVDVEFAQEKGKFYIVQSRPITTIKIRAKPENLLYEAVFTLPYSNIFLTDHFVPAYKEFEPIVTIKDGVWSFWLSTRVLKDLSEIGYKRAFQTGVVTKIRENYKKFGEEIQRLNKVDLTKFLTDEFVDFLEKLKEFVKRFFITYREMEFFYFSIVEKELIKGLPDGTKIEEVLTDDKIILTLPHRKRELARYLIQIQHLKLEYRKLINKLAIDRDSLLSKVFKQLTIRTGRKDTTCLTVSEVKSVLEGMSLRDFFDRHEASFVTYDPQDDCLIIESGSLAIEKIRKLNEDFFKNTGEQIKGQCACSGKAKGKVIVIPFALNITGDSLRFDFKKGEVLVSTTTGPEMVSIMKKASAIITDEGGLMSHAAIIAREFQTPCIVGTKIATRLLKDGDLVEVDAERGVVKILKRAV